MSNLCKTIDEVNNWWAELEEVLYSEIDHLLRRSEIDEADFGTEIHELKEFIGNQLISENAKLSELFFQEYNSKGMPVELIKSIFLKRYDDYMLYVTQRIRLFVIMKGERNG
ncbi:hypothetical protein GIX45_16055 [Erwinia sp. CPCC 100877]|nr:hypothetical protein [Erwinia sp. CPCC 100877]